MKKAPEWAPQHFHKPSPDDTDAPTGRGWWFPVEGQDLALSIVRSPHPEEGGPSEERVHHVVVAKINRETGGVLEVEEDEAVDLTDAQLAEFVAQMVQKHASA